MAEIVWNKGIEAESRQEIEKYLTPYIWLVPKWCQKLIINVYPSERGHAAETTVNYDYRSIKIDFFSDWLIERDEVKKEDVVHELLHGFTAIFVDYAINQIDILCPEDEQAKFNQSIKQQLSILCESMTQDLTFAILNNER